MMEKKKKMQKGEFLLYNMDNEKVNVEVFFRDENIWLSQKLMAKLFRVERSVTTKHLNNIFLSGELNENSVCANFAHTASDKKIYIIKNIGNNNMIPGDLTRLPDESFFQILRRSAYE